jgi:hypothetical protein
LPPSLSREHREEQVYLEEHREVLTVEHLENSCAVYCQVRGKSEATCHVSCIIAHRIAPSSGGRFIDNSTSTVDLSEAFLPDSKKRESTRSDEIWYHLFFLHYYGHPANEVRGGGDTFTCMPY